jgi:hypothetical protein
MIDDEPRPVWMSPLVTHSVRVGRVADKEGIQYSGSLQKISNSCVLNYNTVRSARERPEMYSDTARAQWDVSQWDVLS